MRTRYGARRERIWKPKSKILKVKITEDSKAVDLIDQNR